MTYISEKTTVCLALCALTGKPRNRRLRELLYEAACEAFSEKATLAKLDRLGWYADFGVSSRYSWLTDRGWKLYREGHGHA